MKHLAQFDEGIRKKQKITLLGGVDEAGRGALAGPVVVGAVVLGPEASLAGVNDSKTLKPERREELAVQILAQARSVALGLASAEEVDRINVLQATHLGAARALSPLTTPPEFLITDHLHLKNAACPILSMPKADATSLCVAAASILAKVARDRIMRLLDGEYPDYGFAAHKGYGTAAHLEALERRGPSTIHRLTFGGVCWFNSLAAVRSRSAAFGLPREASSPDLLALLAGNFSGGDARPFLPESEFRDLQTTPLKPARV